MSAKIMDPFKSILRKLFTTLDLDLDIDKPETDDIEIARSLNAAFLISLLGAAHPRFKEAEGLLNQKFHTPQWSDVARFYMEGRSMVMDEIKALADRDPDFSELLSRLDNPPFDRDDQGDHDASIEDFWSLFFPEGVGLRDSWDERVTSLRLKRRVLISELNRDPLTDPCRQILFTSNVLLSLPPSIDRLDERYLSNDIINRLTPVLKETQQYWYDHPVHLGIAPENNEILYGLKGLWEALAFERERGNGSIHDRLKMLLSVSVTHLGLHNITKDYIEWVLGRSTLSSNLEIVIITEADAKRIREDVLVPAARHYIEGDWDSESFQMFGVDGEYGRHYSFLKAIAALWNTLIDPNIRATFKIDLDQVFPQSELVKESGASAFEHFKTPLWGALGEDSHGNPIKLGMIAGALVNERDIRKSLFYPDVTFERGPRPLSLDEYVFCSALPQALSTEAEMGMRYSSGPINGTSACIQRIHVTGGTNGILLDSLFQFRPFTPSFIGRAEDQAYLLSTMVGSGPLLGYLHEDGLIMRHDKEAFAQEAIQSASVSKMIGDFIRILVFSAYAGVIDKGINRIKDAVDPFTGCFISKIPKTLVYLRFALKAVSFFQSDRDGVAQNQGLEFIKMGVLRLSETLKFMSRENSRLKEIYLKERKGWDFYYDTLSALKQALEEQDPFALEIKQRARDIIEGCTIHGNEKPKARS